MNASARRFPVILYFVKGPVPNDEQYAEAAKFGPNVRFRNALLVNNDTSTSGLEECDAVAGDVPERYLACYPNVSELGSDFADRSSDYDLPVGHPRDPLNERGRGARPPSLNERTVKGDTLNGLPPRAAQGWEDMRGLIGGTEGRQEAPVSSPGTVGERVGVAPNDPFAAVPGSPSWPHEGHPTDRDTVGDAKAMTGTVTGDTSVPNEGEAALFKLPDGFSSAAGAQSSTEAKDAGNGSAPAGFSSGTGVREGTPDESWSRDDLNKAATAKGLDPNKYANKAEIVAALNG